MKNQDIQLSKIRRFLNFPLPIKLVAWEIHNTGVLKNVLLTDIFIAFVFSAENKQVDVINHKIVDSEVKQLPQMVIVLPGTIINTIMPSVKNELYFSYSSHLLPIFEKFNFKRCNFAMTDEIKQILETIRYAMNEIHRPGMADRLDVLAIQLASEAMLASEEHQANQNRFSDERIFKVANYIQSNFDKKINLAELLKKYCIPRRTFYREWEKCYNISPMQFQINLKIEQAKTLLKKTSLKIYEISEECGFTNYTYFNYCFTKNCKQSPSDYRHKTGTIPEKAELA